MHAPVFMEQCEWVKVMQMPGVVGMQERKVLRVNCGNTSSVCIASLFYNVATYNIISLVIMRGRVHSVSDGGFDLSPPTTLPAGQ